MMFMKFKKATLKKMESSVRMARAIKKHNSNVFTDGRRVFKSSGVGTIRTAYGEKRDYRVAYLISKKDSRLDLKRIPKKKYSEVEQRP